MNKVENRDYYTYCCQVCGFECRKKLIPGNSVPVTQKGDYGNNATPQPTTFADEMYEATTVSFVAASGDDPAYLADSLSLFSEKHFSSGMTIRVATGSETNDGDYTIAEKGVTQSKILLDESLTTESASTAGTVTISWVLHEPNVTTGCPLCGSLNSK